MIEIKTPSTTVIALWPDGFWCLLEDISPEILYRSDDYERIRVKVDSDGEPIMDWLWL